MFVTGLLVMLTVHRSHDQPFPLKIKRELRSRCILTMKRQDTFQITMNKESAIGPNFVSPRICIGPLSFEGDLSPS